MHAADFFARLASEQANMHRNASHGREYAAVWRQAEQRARRKLAHFLEDAPFGEFKAVWQIMHALPAQSHLQLGNSMPVRYANVIGCAADHTLAGVFGNRGTSGIDGTVSTAVGAALASGVLTTLLVGDLGFFYDRNGLWHRHVPANLRIVVLNNHGGGIFDIIDGPNRLTNDERTEFFLTPQPLNARRTAEDHGLRYFHAGNEQELKAHLAEFFATQDRAALLEIETEMAVNSAVFRQFREIAADLRGDE
jgi:2-succinyl-5-enolpyruvyl-6-hydroxy-3-cyclohexene-1-carboxylate synthase